jgi:hypothetical protein
MQTLIEKSKSASAAIGYPEDRRHFGVPSEPANKKAAVNNNASTEPVSSQEEDKNEEGFIIVKEGLGVFFIRYDIIFAKAGDIFFMPRKVPDNFNSDSDTIIRLNADPGEFDKYFNAN